MSSTLGVLAGFTIEPLLVGLGLVYQIISHYFYNFELSDSLTTTFYTLYCNSCGFHVLLSEK